MALDDLTIAGWERDRFAASVGDEIDALPETPEPEHTAPVEGDPVVLLERSTGGWKTELRLLADGRVAVTAQQGFGGRIEAAIIDPGDALDAFHHPYCYLGRD